MLSWLTDLRQGARKSRAAAKPLAQLGGAKVLLGHGLALGENAEELIGQGIRELGPLYMLESRSGPIAVVASAGELARTPRIEPNAELRRTFEGECSWTRLWPDEHRWAGAVDQLLEQAVLRLQVERVVTAAEATIARWPEAGVLDANEAFGELHSQALAAAIWQGAPPSLAEQLQRHGTAGTSRRGRLAFSLGAQLPLAESDVRLRKMLRRTLRAASAAPRPQEVRRRDLLGILARGGLGDDAALAALIEAFSGELCFHGTQLSLRLADNFTRHPQALEEVLEEQDRVHGDQGDPTFETLRVCELLDGLIAEVEAASAPNPMLLGRLLHPWRLASAVLPMGSQVLLYRQGLSSPLPLWTQQHRLEATLSRLILKAIWSVLWRTMRLELRTTGQLHVTKNAF